MSYLLIYLAFAWVIALKNQVIRLAGHSEFTSTWCPELKHCQEAQTLTEENLTHCGNSHAYKHINAERDEYYYRR